jgi:dihydrofolate reductase
MRKVIASAMVSLDGVMQAPGGPDEDPTGGFKYGGWAFAYSDEVLGQALGELFSKPFDLLLGRKTYEIFSAYWPYQEGGDVDYIAKAFNKARKYVATRSSTPLTWNNSVAIHDAAADVAKLKQQDGPDLLIQGSTGLIQTLLKNDLIDEISLRTYPIVLGSGKRLFGDGAKGMAFTLERSKTTPSGVTLSTYTPSGPVKPGSFVQGKPSDAELKRRERMKREG